MSTKSEEVLADPSEIKHLAKLAKQEIKDASAGLLDISSERRAELDEMIRQGAEVVLAEAEKARGLLDAADSFGMNMPAHTRAELEDKIKQAEALGSIGPASLPSSAEKHSIRAIFSGLRKRWSSRGVVATSAEQARLLAEHSQDGSSSSHSGAELPVPGRP
jgi:hypothetical protein